MIPRRVRRCVIAAVGTPVNASVATGELPAAAVLLRVETDSSASRRIPNASSAMRSVSRWEPRSIGGQCAEAEGRDQIGQQARDCRLFDRSFRRCHHDRHGVLDCRVGGQRLDAVCSTATAVRCTTVSAGSAAATPWRRGRPHRARRQLAWPPTGGGPAFQQACSRAQRTTSSQPARSPQARQPRFPLVPPARSPRRPRRHRHPSAR